eukprot:gene2014-1521_t
MLYMHIFSKLNYTQKHEYVGIINFINLCLDKSGEREGFIGKLWGYFSTNHSKEFQIFCKLLGTFLVVKFYSWSTNQQINENEAMAMKDSITKLVESLKPEDENYVVYQYSLQFIAKESCYDNEVLSTYSHNIGELIYQNVKFLPNFKE